MGTLKLKPNKKIGVLYYANKYDGKAAIEEVEKVSPTGIVTLKNGVRYTSKGKEIGALGDPTYLCTVERAQEVMDKALVREQEKGEKQKAYLASLEGKRNMAAKAAARAAIQVLNQHGWYTEIDGCLDVMESEIESLISDYVNKYNPIK
jgi:hypothetical protein